MFRTLGWKGRVSFQAVWLDIGKAQCTLFVRERYHVFMDVELSLIPCLDWKFLKHDYHHIGVFFLFQFTLVDRISIFRVAWPVAGIESIMISDSATNLVQHHVLNISLTSDLVLWYSTKVCIDRRVHKPCHSLSWLSVQVLTSIPSNKHQSSLLSLGYLPPGHLHFYFYPKCGTWFSYQGWRLTCHYHPQGGYQINHFGLWCRLDLYGDREWIMDGLGCARRSLLSWMMDPSWNLYWQHSIARVSFATWQ